MCNSVRGSQVEAAHTESQELRRRCEELQARNLEMG